MVLDRKQLTATVTQLNMLMTEARYLLAIRDCSFQVACLMIITHNVFTLLLSDLKHMGC